MDVTECSFAGGCLATGIGAMVAAGLATVGGPWEAVSAGRRTTGATWAVGRVGRYFRGEFV